MDRPCQTYLAQLSGRCPSDISLTNDQTWVAVGHREAQWLAVGLQWVEEELVEAEQRRLGRHVEAVLRVGGLVELLQEGL